MNQSKEKAHLLAKNKCNSRKLMEREYLSKPLINNRELMSKSDVCLTTNVRHRFEKFKLLGHRGNKIMNLKDQTRLKTKGCRNASIVHKCRNSLKACSKRLKDCR